MEGLFAQVRTFLSNNGYPLPANFEQTVLENVDEQIQKAAAKAGNEPVEWLRSTEPPTLAEKLTRFARAAKSWAKSGFSVVSDEEFLFRQNQCETCKWWRGSASFGLGNCGKCGCTGIKLYWATEQCPLDPPRWKKTA